MILIAQTNPGMKMQKDKSWLFILLVFPHLFVLLIGFWLCDGMECIIPYFYIQFFGLFYVLITAFLFKTVSPRLQYYLIILPLIYIYCGVGSTTEGKFGYLYVSDLVMMSLGCPPGDYSGYCSKASLINIFYPPLFLLFFCALFFYYLSKKQD